jgi:hypothetical protein
VSEARRNLEVRYPEALGRCTELLRGVTVTSEATPSATTWALGQGLPEEDAPPLAAAVAVQVDLLVTDDRTHFGHLYGRTVGGVLVLGLAEALGRLLGSRG